MISRTRKRAPLQESNLKSRGRAESLRRGRLALDHRLLHDTRPGSRGCRLGRGSGLRFRLRAFHRIGRGFDLKRPDGGEKLIELMQRYIIFVRLKLFFDVAAELENRIDQVSLDQRICHGTAPSMNAAHATSCNRAILADWEKESMHCR